MSYKSLVKASYFFLHLCVKYMNLRDDPRYNHTEEELDELDKCSRGWGWLEAYINWVL